MICARARARPQREALLPRGRSTVHWRPAFGRSRRWVRRSAWPCLRHQRWRWSHAPEPPLARPVIDVNSSFESGCAMRKELMIPRRNASVRAPQDNDVDSMLRGGPRVILVDGGISPATPLPTKRGGPEALRHCLTTVLPRELLYWVREQTARRQVQAAAHRSLRPAVRDVKTPLAALILRLAENLCGCRLQVFVLPTGPCLAASIR